MATRTHAARAASLLLALAWMPASAQVFRCPNGNGLSFQQAPCPGLSASGGRLLMFANGAPAPRRVPVAANAVPQGETARVLGRSPLPSPVTVGQPK